MPNCSLQSKLSNTLGIHEYSRSEAANKIAQLSHNEPRNLMTAKLSQARKTTHQRKN